MRERLIHLARDKRVQAAAALSGVGVVAAVITTGQESTPAEVASSPPAPTRTVDRGPGLSDEVRERLAEQAALCRGAAGSPLKDWEMRSCMQTGELPEPRAYQQAKYALAAELCAVADDGGEGTPWDTIFAYQDKFEALGEQYGITAAITMQDLAHYECPDVIPSENAEWAAG